MLSERGGSCKQCGFLNEFWCLVVLVLNLKLGS